jgi:hypothetical protein
VSSRFLGAACLLIFCAALLSPDAASAYRRQVWRAPGPPRLGPWIEKGWCCEDWSRAPAIRDWAFSAPWNYDPETGTPSSTAEYPWGYTTPFVKVGRRCVASEINGSPGGAWVRYQRVMPSYYCR